MTNAFYNHDAERAILAALLVKDNTKLIPQLMADDFHDEQNRMLFGVIRSVFVAEKAMTLVNIADAMTKAYGSDGAMVDLIEIIRKHTIESWAVKDHIEIVKSAALRRNLFIQLNAARNKLQDPDNDTAAVLDETRQKLRDLIITGHTWHSMQDVLMASFEAIERRSKGLDKPISSGIRSLDSIITGFHRGELTIIGARPAVGKSALGMFIALEASKNKHKVGLCSLEMTDVQYGTRILSSGADVDNTRLRTGQLDPADWAQLANAMELYGSYDVSFMFTARNVEDLRMEIQNAVDSKGLDLVVIDYLQLLQSRQRFDMDFERIGYVSKMLKHMTVDFNIPIIALAQVGRAADGDMPTLSELRGSGEIEQDADNVLFIHRPEDENDSNVHHTQKALFTALKEQGKQYIILNVAKQRQGSVGCTALVFDPARMQYTSIAKDG